MHFKLRVVVAIVLLKQLDRPGKMTTKPFIHTLPKEDIGKKIILQILELSKQAIEDHGYFAIAFSGGSLPMILSQGLSVVEDTAQFRKWKIYFADERYVPLTDPESNYKVCKQELFDKIGITSEQIYTLDPSLSLEDAAQAYSDLLKELRRNQSEVPILDLILLGMGPDGHTCSLFPNHALLEEKTKWIACLSDSPKPPSSRITFTFPILNAAMQVYFVATGESKAELMPHMAGHQLRNPSLPAARVHPCNGEIHWYLDHPAASQLSSFL